MSSTWIHSSKHRSDPWQTMNFWYWPSWEIYRTLVDFIGNVDEKWDERAEQVEIMHVDRASKRCRLTSFLCGLEAMRESSNAVAIYKWTCIYACVILSVQIFRRWYLNCGAKLLGGSEERKNSVKELTVIDMMSYMLIYFSSYALYIGRKLE